MKNFKLLTLAFIRSTSTLFGLLIIVAGLTLYSFTDAQTWATPTLAPPGGNAPAPLNVGTDTQLKNGIVGLNGLVTYNQGVTVANSGPTINYQDTDNDNWWTHVNSDRFYFLADRNDDGNWSGENPWPLEMYAGPNAASDAAYFSNLLAAPYVLSWSQMRSNAYCDQGGGNCIAPWNIQPKVWGTCPAGQAVAQVYADGNVRCQAASGGLNCVTRNSAGSSVSCQSGETMTGGGCRVTTTGCSGGCSDAAVTSSIPSGNGWSCNYIGGSAVTAYVRCCS